MIHRKLAAISLVVALVASAGSATSAFAQSDELEIQLWAPSEMLVGAEYDIFISVKGIMPEDTKFSLLSNNENVVRLIDREITIEKSRSHGIATVEALTAGRADIFAVSSERLLETSVEVVEPALTAAELDIILPSEKVEINQIPAYVFLKDSFGNPMRAAQDIEVTVTTFGNVKTQVNKVTIKKETHYAKLIINVNGNGGISVAADNLISDTEQIEYASIVDDITMRVEVAPDILATSSSGELYVWLERDGMPYIPDRDIKVKLASEDARHLAFSKAIQFSAPLERDLIATSELFIKRGTSFAHTMVWTSDLLNKRSQNFTGTQGNDNPDEDGEQITITAIADEIGSASTEVDIRIPVNQEPDTTRVFAFPELVYDKFHIIVALYADADDDLNNNVDDEEDDDSTSGGLRPVLIGESVFVHITTDSLVKAKFESVRLGKDDLDKRDHYAVIPAETVGKVGLAEVFAVAGGATGSEDDDDTDVNDDGITDFDDIDDNFDGDDEDTISANERAKVDIREPYSEIPFIAVKPLPALTGPQEQDLLLVYVLEEGMIADKELKDLMVKTKPKMNIVGVQDINKVKVVSGRVPYDTVSEKTITVTALAPGYMGTDVSLDITNPTLRNIVAYVPEVIRVNEPFPAVFYATDERGHPIEIIEPSISPGDNFAKISERTFMIKSGSKHAFVFYADGMNPATSTLDVFQPVVQLDISTPGNKFTIGDKIRLQYDVNPPDAQVTLDADELQFQTIKDGFVIESTIPGPHKLVINAERDGFESITKEISIDINVLPIDNEEESEDTSQSNILEGILQGNIGSDLTPLLMIMGILVTAAGGAIYVMRNRKSKSQVGMNPDKDLTYAFSGRLWKWN